MVHATTISPGVNLTCVITDKFKTGCLSINLISSLSHETAASTALLPQVLRRGSKDFPDMARIATALDDLYGARIEPVVRKKGELHCNGFYADFPDERYIPGGESILEKTTSLAGGMLLSPMLDENLLQADYIEGEKKNLIDEIRAGINDKRAYSVDRLLEEMCAGEAYGVNKLGSEVEVRAITPESLTTHYYKLLAAPKIELLYCGSAEPERVAAALRTALKDLPERSNITMPETKIVLYPPDGAPRRITESFDVSQGKMAVGFRLGKAMNDKPDYPAMMVFNTIYGSGVTSKLFLNVRERLSLCYYASSSIDKHKGVMLVSSGVDFSNFDIALDEILAQLEDVKTGAVSDWELLSAKRTIITSVKSAMDSPSGLLELYFDSSLSASPYDPDKLCDMIEDVTVDRIVETASEIEFDTVYFLTGEADDMSEGGDQATGVKIRGARQSEAGEDGT